MAKSTDVTIVPCAERRDIEVRVTHDTTVHARTHWALFSRQPSEFEAYLAVHRALAAGHTHARVVVTTTFSPTD